MSKKLIDRPTEIRDDEKLNNSKLFEYLSEIIDLDIESFDILQFPSGYSNLTYLIKSCLLYTSPSPRDKRQSRMPSSA